MLVLDLEGGVNVGISKFVVSSLKGLLMSYNRGKYDSKRPRIKRGCNAHQVAVDVVIENAVEIADGKILLSVSGLRYSKHFCKSHVFACYMYPTIRFNIGYFA